VRLEELRLLLAEAIRGTRFAGRAYFAGGCVRDLLLGRDATLIDADIAVELPHGGIALALYLCERFAAGKPEIHKSFGTAKLELEGVQLEFVMTRAEVYTPGSRHPRVRFADLRGDCLRRDFTVNALYMEIMEGTVLDPCGMGRQDLKAGIIRSVREPGLSFREDPLRMLRALRFSAVLDLEVNADDMDAIRDNASLISSLSRRRCLSELDRLEQNASPGQKQRWETLLAESGAGKYLREKLSIR
jgi:tRNA nucleotidyltransferase/poly(A) polymerase